jgi:hypothetical protein
MVGLSKYLSKKEVLLKKRVELIEETKTLFKKDSQKLLTGGGKTTADTKNRMEMFSSLLNNLVSK